MTRLLLTLAIASVAGPALGADRIVFSDDFATDPNTSGKWTVTRSDSDPNIGVRLPDGTFALTTQQGGCSGLTMFANAPLTATSWTASFRYFVSANGDSGADGLVFMFYKEAGYVPAGGGWLAFNKSDAQANEAVPGYGVELDDFFNPELNDPSASHVALIQDSVANHLASVNDARTEDGQWHDALVTYDAGHVTFAIDGGTVLDHVLAAPDTSHGGLGFGSGQCAAVNDHVIDDFSLAVPVIEVAIDVKPGMFPNSIRLGAAGLTPVAILSGAGFDATASDAATVVFAGASVARRTNGTFMTTVQDVNGDGFADLVLQFDTTKLQLAPTSTTATLTGVTRGLIPFEGTDSVRIVK